MTKHPGNQGVAIIMVMSSIALLALVLADMTYETNINNIRILNQQEKLQARLNAEAGLNFALAKLKIYQHTRNLLEKSPDLKQMIRPDLIENIIIEPFAFPLPPLPDMNILQKTALEKFAKKMQVNGEIQVSVSPLQGFLNPNIMRIEKKSERENVDPDLDTDGESNNNKKTGEIHRYMEERLVEALAAAMDAKREQDDEFNRLYSNLDPKLLIKELKFYVNDRQAFDDPELPQIESLYSNKKITPKHGPLTSLSELYLLQGWDQQIVDLIINRLTVHEVGVIAINNITSDLLTLLFPDLTDQQVKEFFEYRDGSPEKELEPQPIKSVAEFKEVVTNTLNLVSSSVYEQRVQAFADAGLKLDIANKLFLIKSEGKFNRSSYRLQAYVDIPIKETISKKKKAPLDSALPADNDAQQSRAAAPDPNKKEADNKKIDFLEPRVVEIFIN